MWGIIDVLKSILGLWHSWLCFIYTKNESSHFISTPFSRFFHNSNECPPVLCQKSRLHMNTIAKVMAMSMSSKNYWKYEEISELGWCGNQVWYMKCLVHMLSSMLLWCFLLYLWCTKIMHFHSAFSYHDKFHTTLMYKHCPEQIAPAKFYLAAILVFCISLQKSMQITPYRPHVHCPPSDHT